MIVERSVSVVTVAPGGSDIAVLELAEEFVTEKSIFECFVTPSLIEVSHFVTEVELTSWMLSENVVRVVVSAVVLESESVLVSEAGRVVFVEPVFFSAPS